MTSKISDGKKIAQALAMRYVESPVKGTSGVEVAFRFIESSTGAEERINWVGWLSEKTQERTMQTLVEVLGYNGSQDLGEDGRFTDASVLDFKKQVELVVEIEKNESNGKTYFNPRVKWINNIGGGQFANVEPKVASAKLAALNFRGLFLGAKKAYEVSSPKPPVSAVDESNLPF